MATTTNNPEQTRITSNLLQVDDVAHELGVTTYQVSQWIDSGWLKTLPRMSAHSRVYITRAALDAFLESDGAA